MESDRKPAIYYGSNTLILIDRVTMYGWKDLKTVSAIKNCKEKEREVKKPKHRKCESL